MKMRVDPKIKGIRDNFVKKYPHLATEETVYDAMRGYMFSVSAKLVTFQEMIQIVNELCLEMNLALPDAGPCGARLEDNKNRVDVSLMQYGDYNNSSLSVLGYMFSITKIVPMRI